MLLNKLRSIFTKKKAEPKLTIESFDDSPLDQKKKKAKKTKAKKKKG
tara:strand:+ start:360 stop:500 length:141 start_codon:yes stop_codon:yes gene_type:complete